MVVSLLSIAYFSFSEGIESGKLKQTFIRSFPLASLMTASSANNPLDFASFPKEPGVELTKEQNKNSEGKASNVRETGKVIEKLPEVDEEEPLQGKPIESKIRNRNVINRQYIHFIHIPKCGGTTMTIILRQMQCNRDPEKNKDCCTNIGSFDESSPIPFSC
jgi:hypothetical protein